MNIRISLAGFIWFVAASLAVLVTWQQRALIMDAMPWSGSVPEAQQRPIVVMDMAKLMNAQRALASKLASQPDKTQTASVIAQAGRQTQSVIRQTAGKNSIVLVKQAVVSWPGKMPDITDRVINKLGLPNDAPSPEYSNSRAPTQGNVEPKIKQSRENHQEALDDIDGIWASDNYEPSEDDSIIP